MSNEEELEIERDNNLIWLERYHKTVVGLAALAECHAEGCSTEWMAMQYSLEALADIMREDIEERKKEKEERK